MKSPRRFRGWAGLAALFFAFAVPVYADAQSDLLALFFQASNAVNNSGGTEGERISLVTKIIGAMQAVERGNDHAARGSLGAFVREVRAMERSGRLDSETAEALIGAANAIEDEL